MKTQIVTNLKKLNGDETQKFKFWWHLKTQMVTKLKNPNCGKTEKLKLWTKLKLWHNSHLKTNNSKTQYVTKLKFSDERISWNEHEQISEYIWMPHYVPNEFPNIYLNAMFYTKWICEYIHTPELAQIWKRIIFEGYFTQILEYS